RRGHRVLHRNPGRGGCFPGPDPGGAEIRRVPAGGSAAGVDTQEERKTTQTGYTYRHRPGGPGSPEGGTRTHIRGGLPAVLVRVPPPPPAARRDRRDPPSRLWEQ